MLISELDTLQANLNWALDTIRVELKAAEFPEYSNFPSRHPLDNPDVLTPHGLYEARRLALGEDQTLTTSYVILTSEAGVIIRVACIVSWLSAGCIYTDIDFFLSGPTQISPASSI